MATTSLPPSPTEHDHQVGAGAHGDEHAHHDQHAGHDPEAFRRRFWLCLTLTIPIVLTSEMVMEWFGYELDFPGIELVGPVLGSIVFVWGGRPFLTGAVAEVRARQPGMMLLISLAIIVAYAASMATSLGWFDLEFWWELAALITIMLLGHWLEMRAIGQASGALEALAALLPDEAERVEPDGSLTVVPIAELDVGDIVLVRPGGRVPADGTIVDGSADLDESMVTGESRPVRRHIDDRVVAGTVATDSSLRIRVDAVGDDTALAGIQRLVREAQTSHSRAQALADRFAGLLFYIASVAAALTFAIWAAVGELEDAVVRTVTVLVIACPHALGLAIPLVISLSTAVGARAGVLVKDRLALERTRTVDTVLFDKTGTLTLGQHVVTAVVGRDLSDDEILAIAGATERESEHPLARAIVAAAQHRGPLPPAEAFTAHAGRGVEATVAGTRYAIGGPALLRQRRITDLGPLAPTTAELSGRGAVVLHLVRGDEVIGLIALEDEVRPEAGQAVSGLHEQGISVGMITGDARNVAEAVGTALGVDQVLAEVLPEDKEHHVTALQEEGRVVAMVGDGVNDAPALARADVGIAIGAGTDVAIESAGVVLASNDPRGVLAVLRLSRASYRKMRQNLAWAAGYNIVAIPLAAGALSWAGINLGPEIGAVLMSLSTVVVALNAQLLRRVDLRPEGVI